MRLSPRRVIVESPFGAPNPEAVARNLKYLRACMKDCLDRGEAPFASHGLYTQEGVLDDWKPDEREKGIRAGFAWRQVAEVTVFYVDLGISGGMRAGLKHAQKVIDSAAFPHTMEYRWLGGEWAAFADPEEIKRILGELTHTVDPTALKQADPHLYSKQVPTDLIVATASRRTRYVDGPITSSPVVHRARRNSTCGSHPRPLRGGFGTPDSRALEIDSREWVGIVADHRLVLMSSKRTKGTLAGEAQNDPSFGLFGEPNCPGERLPRSDRVFDFSAGDVLVQKLQITHMEKHHGCTSHLLKWKIGSTLRYFA